MFQEDVVLEKVAINESPGIKNITGLDRI